MGSTPAGFQEAFRAEYMRDMIHWLSHQISHEFSLGEHFARSALLFTWYLALCERQLASWYELSHELFLSSSTCVTWPIDSLTDYLTNSRVQGEILCRNTHKQSCHTCTTGSVSRTLAYRVRYWVDVKKTLPVVHVWHDSCTNFPLTDREAPCQWRMQNSQEFVCDMTHSRTYSREFVNGSQ